MMRVLLKWIGIILGLVAALIIIAFSWLYFTTEARFEKVYEIPEVDIEIPDNPDYEGRNFPIVVVDFCKECHGQDMGGQIMEDDPMMARLIAPNLTAGRGGIGGKYTDEDWILALRYGIRRDGKPLIVMPSLDFNSLSVEDLGIVISMVRNSPPVDKELPDTFIGPMGRLFLLQGMPIIAAESIDFKLEPKEMPEPGVSIEYGEYLAFPCALCHGKDFSGIDEPGGGVNLTVGGELKNWSEADFIKALRTGQTPEGDMLDQEMMPVRIWSKLNDDEVKAIWLYINSLPPVVKPTPTPTE